MFQLSMSLQCCCVYHCYHRQCSWWRLESWSLWSSSSSLRSLLALSMLRRSKLRFKMSMLLCQNKPKTTKLWRNHFAQIFSWQCFILCKFGNEPTITKNKHNLIRLYVPTVLVVGMHGWILPPVLILICDMFVYAEFLIHPVVLLSTSSKMRNEIVSNIQNKYKVGGDYPKQRALWWELNTSA